MAERTPNINDILQNGNPEQLLALFLIRETDDAVRLAFRFSIWARYFYPRFFTFKDAEFHTQSDEYLAQLYLGEIDSFSNLGFRGCAKTTRSKLFRSYVIANDRRPQRRRYFKILTEDSSNSTQIVTDVYNLLIEPRVRNLYPEIFEKSEYKREETMSSFTTATGVKVKADTVGAAQRGDIQDEARPDWVEFDDFETRKTLRSAVVTKAIWDNMEEARNGLAKGGACHYLGNYLSEAGNVHKLVQKANARNPVLIVPIWDEDKEPFWPAKYTREEIEAIQAVAEDFEGEYLCEPSKGKDILVDRERLAKMGSPVKKIIGDLHIFHDYDPSHDYAGGQDVAGGVGLDSSTNVIIDFSTVPARVVASYASNTIKPEAFGSAVAEHGRLYGECLVAPENNKFDSAIGQLKREYPNEMIYITQRDDSRVNQKQSVASMEFGWNTNTLTKPKMVMGAIKAINDGLLDLSDPRIVAEARSYTRNDLMDSTPDPRLTTRHFDLFMAVCIAWQMKDCQQLTLRKRKQQAPKPPRKELQVSEYDTVIRRESQTVRPIEALDDPFDSFHGQSY